MCTLPFIIHLLFAHKLFINMECVSWKVQHCKDCTGNMFGLFKSVTCYKRYISSDTLQSFLNFILPFEWKYTYVPILSSKSLELLEAPGTFMMGCHSKYKEEVNQVRGHRSSGPKYSTTWLKQTCL